MAPGGFFMTGGVIQLGRTRKVQRRVLTIRLEKPGQSQQTIVVMPTSSNGRGQRFGPMVKRGAHVCGHRIGGPCLIAMVIAGVIGIISTLNAFYIISSRQEMFEIPSLRPPIMKEPFNEDTIYIIINLGFVISGTCILAGCCGGCKAKREWDALPRDHPDRIKYTAVTATTVPSHQQPGGTQAPPGDYLHPTPGGFQVPPGNYPQPSPGGYNQPPGNYNQLPSCTYNLPPFDYNQPPPASGNYSYQSGQPTAPPPPNALDPPPSYDQVMQDMNGPSLSSQNGASHSS